MSLAENGRLFACPAEISFARFGGNVAQMLLLIAISAVIDLVVGENI